MNSRKKSKSSANKFIEILKKLDNNEFRTFRKWLNSPWCNSNKNLAKVFEVIKKYHPKLSSPKLEYEALFRAALPDLNYTYSYMSNLMSEGYAQVEDFLIHQHLRQNENTRKNFLAAELQRRRMEKPFFQTSEKAIEKIEGKPIKDWEDYLDLLKLNRRIYHHPNQNPRIKPGASPILKMDENLDLVYLLEKAAIINEKIFRNRILKNENYDVEADLKIWLTASDGVEHLSVDFYRRRFGYTEKNMLNEYFNLKLDFFERFKDLNQWEQKVHLISLINDTAYLRKKGLVDFSENFGLYKLGLDTGVLLHQGEITRITFVTFVQLANFLKKFDLTKAFIKNYSDLLSEEIKEDGKMWATAHVFYREKKLKQCLDSLLAYESKTPFFKRATKILTLQTYFDLFLEDASYQFYLLNYCDAYEKWVQRERTLSEISKEAHFRFIQTCRFMIKSLTSADFREEKFLAFFKNQKNSHAVNWLTEKRKKIIELKT